MSVQTAGLIINALDAMPDGGTLQLALTKGRTIRVQVSDSGTGIQLDRLSDERQLHVTTKALTSGLGLYATRGGRRSPRWNASR